MAIEGELKFLNRISLGLTGAMTDEHFPCTTWLNMKLALAGLVGVFTSEGIGPLSYDDESIDIVDDTVSMPRKDGPDVYSREVINERKLSVPTMIPGLRLHLFYQ